MTTYPPTIALSFLSLFFHLLFTIPVTSYRPNEHFAVNCGNSGNLPSYDQRNWTGDIGSLFSLIDPDNSTLSIKADAQVSQTIPYGTARLSRSEFSYSFPMSDGQKFIRLYFYPFSHDRNLLRSDSLFTVKAGLHTLLEDFNASLNADAGASLNAAAPKGAIVREYCVNVDAGQRLNITFTPSRSHPNAYAFVNGIKVVSMPTFLYYTKPDDLQTMLLNDGSHGIQQLPVKNSSALETVYRINVGGSQIASDKDTGMFRYWEQDNTYLERERPYSVSAGFGLKLDYKDYPNYTAPDTVYLTARNYGMKETSKFNVTWEFQVDSAFFYMVRLHFCEFDQHIEKAGGRVFQIFINDALVEPIADVMLWSHRILAPVHRDYAVSMQGKGNQKKLNLSIKLQPHPTAASIYRDVLLNGIEILKISDYSDNLGGPNPALPPSPLLPPMPSSKSSKKTRAIPIVLGTTTGFVVLYLIILLIFGRLIRAPVNEGESWWGRKSADSSNKNKSHGSSLPSDLCRSFSIEEIRAATDNCQEVVLDVSEIEGKSEEQALLRKASNMEESKVVFMCVDRSRSESKGDKLTTSSSEDQQPLVSGLIFSELDHPTVH